VDVLTLVWYIRKLSRPIDGVDAQSEDFDLGNLLLTLPFARIGGFTSTSIGMALSDLNRDFHYIWYPGPDDINLFDDTY
jgi:hypothetical protein